MARLSSVTKPHGQVSTEFWPLFDHSHTNASAKQKKSKLQFSQEMSDVDHKLCNNQATQVNVSESETVLRDG
jgi:hypothetical protein